jgi:GNAT superfamily N-acetyltransferase
MAWRVTRAEWEKGKGAPNKRAFKRLVRTGRVPGLLAYLDGEPIGWCAVEPRESYPTLERSRILKPVDGQAVWSVVCFFVAKPHRRTGVSVALLAAATDYARRHGARIVEGYPVDPAGALPDAFVWTGLAGAFRRAGFTEVIRRSRTRPIMRWPANRSKGA